MHFFLLISRMHRRNLTCLVKSFVTIPAHSFGEKKLFGKNHGFGENEMCCEYTILLLQFCSDFIKAFKRATAGTGCCFVLAQNYLISKTLPEYLFLTHLLKPKSLNGTFHIKAKGICFPGTQAFHQAPHVITPHPLSPLIWNLRMQKEEDTLPR